MKKYRINNFLLVSILLASLYACSDGIMDDINKNKNNPLKVPARFTLTDVMTATAFNVVGNDYNYFASCYMEHNVGIFNQMYYAEVRVSEPYTSSTYNNSWVASYQNLWWLRIVMGKCSEGGSEAGNYPTLGIAQVLTAYNLALLTDLMGDVPWSESSQPGVIYQPKLDKQEEIYKDVLKLLDDAIVNLGKKTTQTAVGVQDLIYKGDTTLWKKTAYALKARYTMRLSFRNPQYQAVIDFADKAFENESDQTAFYYNGASSTNPNYQFFEDRDYFGSSQSLHNKMVSRNDPRIKKYFVPYPGTSSLVFAPNGSPQQVQGQYGVSGLLDPVAPTFLMSYHELLFLKAEAYARLNNKPKAEEALSAALQVAFKKVGLTAADAHSYLNGSIRSNFDKDPVSEIMVQKYLAFFDDESVEAYNDYRRLKAMGDNFILLDNRNFFPLRYVYGSSDVTTNKHVEAAYGDGQYIKTENVWWAGGTR